MGLASGQVAKGNTRAVPQEGCWAGSSLRMTGMLCMTREGGALFQIPISPLSVIARIALGGHTHPAPYSPGLTSGPQAHPCHIRYLFLVFMRPCPCPLPIQASKKPQEAGGSGYSHLHPSWFAPGPRP